MARRIAFGLVAILGLIVAILEYRHFSEATATPVEATLAAANQPPPAPVEPNTARVSASSDAASDADNFQSSKDLGEFVRSLQSGVFAGDALAMRQTARALEECASYSQSPNDIPALMETMSKAHPGRSEAIRRMGTRWMARCKEFSEHGAIVSADYNVLFDKAKQAGDMYALARSLSRVSDASALKHGEADDIVRAVRASRDADAYMALADRMGDRASDFGLPENLAGSRVHEAAWRIAACRLGADCSSQSSLMARVCFSGASCSGGLLAHLRNEVLTPAEYAEAERLAEAILTNN